MALRGSDSGGHHIGPRPKHLQIKNGDYVGQGATEVSEWFYIQMYIILLEM